MAWETGTAAGYIDLLQKLNTFLTTNADLVAASRNWTTVYSDTVGENGFMWQAPGLDGLQSIYAGVITYSDVGSDFYNWRLTGAIGYDSGLSIFNQPGDNPHGSNEEPKLYLTEDAIQYWFIANGQRCIIVARVSTVYQIGYLGFFLPYTTPDQYPYPIMLGGMGRNYSQRWSEASDNLSAFFDPYGSDYSSSGYGASLTVRMAGGQWQNFFNNGRTRKIYPSSYCSDDAGSEKPTYIRNWRNGPGNDYALMPFVLVVNDDDLRCHFGEFDGVFAVSGYSNASEDNITIDSVDYLVVQNGFRTTSHDYAAIRLD